MDRAKLVGSQRAGVLDRARRAHVELVDEDEHDVAAQDGSLGRGPGIFLELVGLGLVLAVQTHEHGHHDRHEHDHHPRAEDGAGRLELGDADDHVDHRGEHRARAVDEQARPPARLLVGDVVLGHARLRQRERGEHTDRVERDQVVDLGARDDHQHGRGRGQRDDPVGEDEAVAPFGELPGHEVVAGMEAGQAREVGKARIGRQYQNQHRSGLQAVVEEVADGPAAEDDLPHLRDHRGSALHVGRRVHLGGEDRQPEEHGAERRPHDHERRPRVPPLRGHRWRSPRRRSPPRPPTRTRASARTPLHPS